MSRRFSLAARSLSALTLVFLMARPGLGETCSECQRKVQAVMSTCRGKISRTVKYADPKKPTDAERKAAADHLDESRACSLEAREGFNKCRQPANCR